MNDIQVRKALFKKLRERNHDPMLINYAIGLLDSLTAKEVKKILNSLDSEKLNMFDK